MKNPKVQFNTNLELQVALDLDAYCERENVAKSYVVGVALRKFLKENE
ncbi:MAG: hypothetical protein KKB59_18335 [Spirochaetes bacterium]|nr:hypothetical protein [Spirochaetota bacterium]